MNVDKGIETIINGLLQLEDKDGKFAGKVLSLAEIDYTAFNTWEWPQGVALFGLVKLYEDTGDEKILTILKDWFDCNYDPETPKNINTCAPMLGVLCLLENSDENEKYDKVVQEWIDWIVNDLPRTEENGFQHSVSERGNENELWDDTLFMTCMFLMRYAKYTGDRGLMEEVIYQFDLHAKYLYDKSSGGWYHGWNFNQRDNFADALWCRGNSWITLFIPEYIEHLRIFEYDYLIAKAKYLLNSQLMFIENKLSSEGMFPTLLDDPQSYGEMSGTLGILAGYLKAKRMGLIDEKISLDITKTVQKLLNELEIYGIVCDVSYGTPMGSTLDFYREIPITPMPYGQSLALLFLIELKKVS